MTGVSVIIPVGPDPAYKLYLLDCIKSVVEQMEANDEILIVDDMALLNSEFFAAIPVPDGAYLHYAKNEWLLGCAASWNIGVGLARNENCILMGSDDKLMPGCLTACKAAINAPDYDPFGYYNLTCDVNGERVAVFNNAAMVSKKLWYHMGGFPITASVGGPDALLISIMLVHMPTHLHQLQEGTVFYWCRSGSHQDTLKQAAFFSHEIVLIRNRETARWTHPIWCDSVQSQAG